MKNRFSSIPFSSIQSDFSPIQTGNRGQELKKTGESRRQGLKDLLLRVLMTAVAAGPVAIYGMAGTAR